MIHTSQLTMNGGKKGLLVDRATVQSEFIANSNLQHRRHSNCATKQLSRASLCINLKMFKWKSLAWWVVRFVVWKTFDVTILRFCVASKCSFSIIGSK